MKNVLIKTNNYWFCTKKKSLFCGLDIDVFHCAVLQFKKLSGKL